MFSLRFNADKVTRQLTRLEADLVTTVKDVMIPNYFQQLQRIGAEAARVGRNEIKASGRIDTSKFHDKLKWEARSRSKGVYEIRIGWLDGEPDWASYQELGFNHRAGMYVTGVDALGAARRYAALEIEKLRKQ